MKKALTHPAVKEILILALMALAIFVPRSQTLGTYATSDEPQYLKLSASFYYLLHEGRFEDTDLIVHPGITTLWAGAGGFWRMFPEYVNTKEADYPIADLHFHLALKKNGFSESQLMAMGRAVSVIIQSVMLLAAFYFARSAFGLGAALLGTLLISFDPFYFANSRILQPDGILTTCMYLSLVSLLSYLKTRRYPDLLVSGAAAGLAWLSKVPGFMLLGLVGLILLANWWWGTQAQSRTRTGFMKALKDGLIWVLVAIVIFVALWPAMWVKPLEVLSELADFTLSASGEVNSPMFFNGEILPEGEFGLEYWYYYPLSFLWRTTPIVLLGLLLGLGSIFLKSSEANKGHFNTLALLGSVLLMVVLFTLSAKKFDRYILPALPLIDMLAAFGYLAFFARARNWFSSKKVWQLSSALVLAATVALQGWYVYQAAPYFHSYYNPLMGGPSKAPQVMMIGWGEGLNEAAQFLNKQPNASTQVVYSWHAAALDMHYEYRSEDLPISAPISDEFFEQLLQADFIVTYIHQWQRGSSARLLAYLADKQPVYTVTINGLEYVKVYDMAALTGRNGQSSSSP